MDINNNSVLHNYLGGVFSRFSASFQLQSFHVLSITNCDKWKIDGQKRRLFLY